MENLLLVAVIVCVAGIGALTLWVHRLSKVEAPQLPSPHAAGYINRTDLALDIEKAGQALTHHQLKQVQDHLNKHSYLPGSHLRTKFARKTEVAKMVSDEVAKRVAAFMASRKPEAITKVMGEPDAVTIPNALSAPPIDTVPDLSAPVNPEYVEPDSVEALKVAWLVLRYALSLDDVVIAQLRAPLEVEVAKLREEIERVLNPLKEDLLVATSDLQEAESKRLKADISFRELNREAERHASDEVSRNPAMNEEAEFERYRSGREALQAEREQEFKKAKAKLKEAEAVLKDFEHGNESKDRLDAMKAELEKFDALADIIAELQKASYTSSNSIRPPAPAGKRFIPTKPAPKAKLATEDNITTLNPDDLSPDFTMDISPPEAGDGDSD